MKNSNTLFLTGLRGYSALAVFLIHSGGGGFRSLGDWANKFVDLGKYGVISFFVLSALTLAMSMGRTRKFSYAHYLKRRFARIFPMYCVAIIIFWWLGGNDYYQRMFGVAPRDYYDLFMHLTFLNLWDVHYQGSILGVEWTVPIEMWTYLIIPPLFFLLNRQGYAWKWAVFFAALALSLANPLWHREWLGAHWAIETYLYCFIGGIIAYSYWGKVKLSTRAADWCLQDFAGKFENYYKFALVRNPWDWQVSYYFHLRQSWQNPRRELFCEEFPTFEEWLKNSERQTQEKYGGRFCWENELFDNICHYEGRFLPDYVGKVETLFEDIHEILRINNIEIPCSLDRFQQENKNRNFVAAREKIQSNVINATKHAHYSTYYTDELIELVARHNRNIISRNSYVFEDRRVTG